MRTFGPDHPDVAATHNNIGNVLDDMGMPEEALEMLLKSNDVKIKVYGQEHPVVADTKVCHLNT